MRSRSLSRLPALAMTLVGTLGFASTAQAQQTADQKAAAQVLFEQGRDLVMAKKFGEACPKLVASLKLDPGLGTMLWLGDCYENSGRTASAWAEFKDAAAVAARLADPREAVARRRVAALEPRLTWLVIEVPATARFEGLELRRDGALLSSSEYGLAIPVDPGVHAVVATGAGRRSWTVKVDVPALPEHVTVTVPVLEQAPREAVSIPAEPMPVPVAAVAPAEASSSMRVVGLVVAGAGVVGIGAGGILGLTAKSAYDDSFAGDHCLPNNECDQTGKDRRDAASSLALGSTIGFVAGGAALATGAVLYFLAPRSARTGLTVVPAFAQRSGGLLLVRHF